MKPDKVMNNTSIYNHITEATSTDAFALIPASLLEFLFLL